MIQNMMQAVIDGRQYVWDSNTLEWVRATQADQSGVTDNVGIASDSVGLARQSQLPTSIGQTTMAGSLSVTLASNQTATVYATKITVSGTTTYVGKAAVGSAQASAVWQCQKIDESSGTVITWADGNAVFDNVATDLSALTYS
jgi:hypothetical protein